MKSHRATVLLLIVLPALAVSAKDKKQQSLPAVFGQARYVYVEAVNGREFDPNLDAADREAIADVRDALRAWGRYTYTTEREQADLVFVVRKGRIAEGDVGVSNSPFPQTVPAGAPNAGSQRGAGPVVSAGAEMGPRDDLFEVCQMNPNGKVSGPLWQHSMPDGLTAPRITLFQQFKEAVEKAYPLHPASPPPSQPASPASKP
jgi:hypothetical protein